MCNPMRPSILAALLLMVPSAVAMAQEIPEDFRKEWPDFRYLEPKQVRGLPAALRADLEKRNCRVPMFTKWDGPHNAIPGQFIKAGQQDWAVLCATPEKTTLLLYAGGDPAAVQPLRGPEHVPAKAVGDHDVVTDGHAEHV